jgi:hypothetical protein
LWWWRVLLLLWLLWSCFSCYFRKDLQSSRHAGALVASVCFGRNSFGLSFALLPQIVCVKLFVGWILPQLFCWQSWMYCSLFFWFFCTVMFLCLVLIACEL